MCFSLLGRLTSTLYRKSYKAFDGLSWHFFDWDGSLHYFHRKSLYLDFAEVDNTCEETVDEVIDKIVAALGKPENSLIYRHFMEQMKEPEGAL